MSKDVSDLVNLNEEFKIHKKELFQLLETYNQKNNKLDEYIGEVNSLKNELNDVKEINNKTKDFLLLELESNLDKQKQIVFEQNSKVNSFKEIINLLKEENNSKIVEISELNEDVGRFKQCLLDKNNLINS